MAAAGVRPGLAVVLVGSQSASEVYVRGKVKARRKWHLQRKKHAPPESVTTENCSTSDRGFKPAGGNDGHPGAVALPPQVDAKKALAGGRSSERRGRIPSHERGLSFDASARVWSLHPAGVMENPETERHSRSGTRTVVVGAGDIVGKPVAMLLLNGNATVTVCPFSRPSICRECVGAPDILGPHWRAGMITRDYVKPGATVIDVGMNQVSTARS